mmetsp:Transcript_7245/g.10910  ORF Transcript_7245/g.10910 Transcript_7245/m.10910 type:complete len:368 (-) Transcript_7245:35-1138(-)
MRSLGSFPLIFLLILVLVLLFNILMIQKLEFCGVEQQMEQHSSKILDLDSWIAMAPELVETIEPRFTAFAKKPFVFFHIRKAAGSMLRSTIFKATGRSTTKTWIPCEGRRCIPFSLPPNDKVYNVYASHVNYVHMTQVMRELDANWMNHAMTGTVNTTLENYGNAVVYHLDDSHLNFDCLTNLRPTVSRVVSCWNYRMTLDNPETPKTWSIPHSYEMSANDWETMLPLAYDQYSNGCNNEIARIFGSTQNETAVNTLSPSGVWFDKEFETIALRLSRCVIVLPKRCQESNTILKYYLPWLAKTTDLCREQLNKNQESVGNTLQEHAKEAILEQNYMDELLFQFGEALFEKQLAIAKSHLIENKTNAQ